MKLILSSNEDPASKNIKRSLLDSITWQEVGEIFSNMAYRSKELDAYLVTIDDPHITHEEVDKEIEEEIGIKIDLAIILSRHRSKTGEPTLTVHPIGNFGNAEFGGRDRTLVKASPRLMTQFLRILKRKAEKLYHRVSFEVTHHGPYLNVKTFYVEVGSDEKEWNNLDAAKAVASAVAELLKNFEREEDLNDKILVGLGGGHYAPRFTDLVFERKVSFGHMIPNYQIEAGNIDEEMIMRCVEATPGFNGIYVHRKGMKKSKLKMLEKKIEDMGIDIYKSEDLELLN